MKEKVFSKKLHLCIDRIKRSKYEYKELLYLDFTPVYIKYNVIIEISINYKSNVIYRIDNVFNFTDTEILVKDIVENIKNYLYNNNKYIIKGKYMKLISKNELKEIIKKCNQKYENNYPIDALDLYIQYLKEKNKNKRIILLKKIILNILSLFELKKEDIDFICNDNIEYEVQDYEILDSINKLNIYQNQEINHLDYLIYELLLKIKQIEGET